MAARFVIPAQPIPLEEAREWFRPEGQGLVWARSPNRGIQAGDKAGNLNRKGYMRVSFKGRTIQVHRLVWLLHHGAWPDVLIDHIDGDKTNNSIGNLRLCGHSENRCNSKPAGASGVKGVTWHAGCQKWQAYCNGKYLGLFSELSAAAHAYDSAARVAFGQFARLNAAQEAAA